MKCRRLFILPLLLLSVTALRAQHVAFETARFKDLLQRARLDLAACAHFLEPYRTGQRDSTQHVAAYRRDREYWTHAHARRYANELELAARLLCERPSPPDEASLVWAGRAVELDKPTGHLRAGAAPGEAQRLGHARDGSRLSARRSRVHPRTPAGAVAARVVPDSAHLRPFFRDVWDRWLVA